MVEMGGKRIITTHTNGVAVIANYIPGKLRMNGVAVIDNDCPQIFKFHKPGLTGKEKAKLKKEQRIHAAEIGENKNKARIEQEIVSRKRLEFARWLVRTKRLSE